MVAVSPPKEITARIVFWGAEGAGKSTSLSAIHAKLKPDNRGPLVQVPTRLDPTVTYEEFPIQLGSIGGVRMQLRVFGVPGAGEHAHTRKQLLDEIDGIVLVVDAQESRVQANIESVNELRSSLEAYGRKLEELPVVIMYNKRDLSDPYTIEALHRRIAMPDAAVFETVASEAKGILNALTTISKRVVRVMRERGLEPESEPEPEPIAVKPMPAPVPVAAPLAPPAAEPQAKPEPIVIEPAPASSSQSMMEAAIIAEADDRDPLADHAIRETQSALDRPWNELEAEAKASAGLRVGADLKIISVGTAHRAGQRGVRVPIVLGNDEGESVSFALTIQLDPLLDGNGDT